MGMEIGVEGPLGPADADELLPEFAPVARVAGGRAVVKPTAQVMASPSASLASYVLRVAPRSTSYRQR